MTSTLAPAPGVPPDQLDLLRRQLAHVLQYQDITTATAGRTPGLDALSLQPGIVDQALLGAFTAELGEAATLAPNAPVPDLRVFRRELPVRTSQHPASVPAWAAGTAVDHTLGPFIDYTGRWLWFDFFRRVHTVSVIRGTEVFLQVPIRGLLTTGQEYILAAGSVWLKSQLLAPSAPGGAYTGVRIKGGRLSFHGPVTLVGSAIVIIGSDTCELALELDQPMPDVTTDTSTGSDAKDLTIHLPAQATIECTPGHAVVTQAGEADQQVYSAPYRYTRVAGTVVFDATLNRILIPYRTEAMQVTVPAVTSDLIGLSGAGVILGSFWALPVTVAALADLGSAAGVGALAMRVGPGLRARWAALDRGQVQLKECYLLTEPGRIALTAAHAGARSRSTLEMWGENNPGRHVRSQVELAYGPTFVVLYNCLSSGAETIILDGAVLVASLDRPVMADGQRLTVRAPAAAVYFLKIKANRFVQVRAIHIIQQHPGAIHSSPFALRNAFITTIGVDDFYLSGVWSAPKDIDKGFLALVWPISSVKPTLPDPYVTNYNPMPFGFRQQAAGVGIGVSLAGIVQWPDPGTAALRFLLLPEAVSSGGYKDAAVLSDPSRPVVLGAALTTEPAGPRSAQAGMRAFRYVALGQSQIAETQKEDAANLATLESLFHDALQLGTEDIFLLDVSTNADLFGVGIGAPGTGRTVPSNGNLQFFIEGMDLTTYAFNTRIYTLPQVQWEPVQTIQNPDVSPYPFPSPATSPTTGDPTLIGTESYRLVPITPTQVVDAFMHDYNDPAEHKRMAALFSLPFGMKAAALLANPDDRSQPGATVQYNQPTFATPEVKGGLQISVVATSPNSGPDVESPGFHGATIQTRNLIDLLTGSIPTDTEGKPLSVLGPVVDTVFNREFKPAGDNARVPLERIDLSGYGASIFSNWLNPNAQIAATSQTRFDVLIGRTSHEVVQVKSILYPWGVSVVRTITIQRTSGGGVTRYDSGWQAQAAGLYDFSYYDASHTHVPNPYEIHPGVIGGVYNVTRIRDTGRMYRRPAADPHDDVIMEEVFFNVDVLIENPVTGANHGFVPSKGQRGFVQLAPYQKPLTPQQFYDLLATEGALGGSVDCVVDVGRSGQLMRLVQVDVNGVDHEGGKVFVAAGHGSLALPKEGAWSLAMRKTAASDIITLDADGALPLIREGRLSVAPTQPYRFADPADIKQPDTPDTDYGLLHSTGPQKVLFLRPTIASSDARIRSTIPPYFADSYAILGSKSVFPALNTTFPLGSAGTVLAVLGEARLRLDSGGNFIAPAGLTRDLLNTVGSRIYVDYSDRSGSSSEVNYAFDSTAPVPWEASVRKHSVVVDLLSLTGVLAVTSDLIAQAGVKPSMSTPVTKFGPALKPIVDLISFLGDFNMAQALRVTMGNAKNDSWQPKWKASLLGLKVEYPLLRIRAFGKHVGGASELAQEAFEKATPLPPQKLELEIEIEAHYNMRPFSFTSDDPTTDIVAERDDMLSVGASLKFGGEIHILFAAVSPTLGLYFYGMIEFEFGVDSKEGKSFEFKLAVGLEVATKWPVVGDVAIALALGLDKEMKDKDDEQGFFVLMVFKGEAELLGGVIAIGIHIEAKGGEVTESHSGLVETYGVCEVEFAAEVSLAFVIHFEFDVTWQEKKRLS